LQFETNTINDLKDSMYKTAAAQDHDLKVANTSKYVKTPHGTHTDWTLQVYIF